MAKDHLNYDQMRLTHGEIGSLTKDKDMQGLLMHVVDHSPTPVIGRKTQGRHIQLLFKGDGMVVMPSTPADARSVANSESQIRRSLASHGFEFPTTKQIKKQKKKKKDTPEEPPAE